MLIKECILLAGGLGTRLRSAVPDLPKCMAPVAGKPFIAHLINYFLSQGIESFIFSLGYMHEHIEEFLHQEYKSLQYKVAIEEVPLGTGGAIKLSASQAEEKNILVANGDTMFRIDVKKLSAFHCHHDASCTLALKPMHQFNRYGVVEINKDGYLQSFREKQFYEQGLINGGVYALHVPSFLETGLEGAFSFEKDYLEKYYHVQKMMGLIQDEYFIDIGIPEDFKRANIELR